MLQLSTSDLVRRYLPWALAAAVLVWHSLQYNFVTDDAYISFVFSENFAEHGQLVFNPGNNPVEGYTNFLWTLLLGILMWAGIAPEVSSLVLGTGFALGTMAMTMRIVARVYGERSVWDALPAAFLALSASYACWSSGGLETQMFTFWVFWAIDSYLAANDRPRAYVYLGLALALGAMTRPEGLLITGLVGLHRLAFNVVRDRRLRPHKHELLAVGVFLIVWGPWFAWRWWYYGHLFPNTYYVKAAGEASAGYAKQMRANGLYYVKQWALQTKALWAAPLVVVGCAVARPRSARFFFGSLVLGIAAVYLVYTVRVGGDFMGLYRFVMPVLVFVALGLGIGLREVLSRVPAFPYRCYAIGALVALLLAVYGYGQVRLTAETLRYGNWKSDRGIDTPNYLATYAEDRKRIGKHMRECFREDDFSIFGGVGAKPFYAKARGIDVFGLVSEVIAHEVPRTRPRAGHNKWGPDPLLYDTYKPDFVFSCYSLHTDPKRPRINCNSGSQRFWRDKGYALVTLHIPGLIERGEYYTFYVAGDRVESFVQSCPGVVK